MLTDDKTDHHYYQPTKVNSVYLLDILKTGSSEYLSCLQTYVAWQILVVTLVLWDCSAVVCRSAEYGVRPEWKEIYYLPSIVIILHMYIPLWKKSQVSSHDNQKATENCRTNVMKLWMALCTLPWKQNWLLHGYVICTDHATSSIRKSWN
jgi:hypothetical protein